MFGRLAQPSALLLAAPGRSGRLRAVGSSTPLARAAALAIGQLLKPTGETMLYRGGLPRGDDPPSEVRLVEPLVVEVSADVAIDRGGLRHPVRFIRVRVDLTLEDLARI